jgi:membrane protein required for colicin V production
MEFNWLDIILLVIIAAGLVLGIIKGLVRQLVGILAVVVGFVLGLAYYPYTASIFRPVVSKDSIANFLGFLLIFLAVILLGWLVSRIFAKVMKGSVKVVNHFFGGMLGLLKGALICGVLVFALLVFPMNIEALKGSFIAPYCAKVTKTVVGLIPQELKQKFVESYDEFIRKGEDDVERI